MTFDQLLRILWVRKRIILLTTALMLGVAVGLSLLLPAQYKASTTVVVDMKTPDPVLGLMMPNIAMASYMATQVDMIGSLRVARRVVETLGLDRNASILDDWRKDTEGRGDPRSWIAELLLKRVDVKPSKESNVIEIVFTGADPAFSATLANTFAQSYIDTVSALRTDPAQQNVTFFDAQAKAAREAMEVAQKRLNDYQRDNGIVSIDERLDVENQRLAELTSQYTVAQSQAFDSQSREGAANRRSSDSLQEVQQSALIQGLKVEQARLEGKVQEVRTRLGTSHPQYASAQAELAVLRGKLEAETNKVQASISTSNAVNRQRESQLRAAMEAQRDRVLRLKAQRDQVGALQAELLQAQKNYEIVGQRLTQTSLESENRLTNVAVLSAASEPVEPSFPKPWLNALLAVVLGVLLGSLCALLLELQDRRIRAADDLTAVLRAPLLARLPDTTARRARRRSSPRFFRRAAAGPS
ncbi:MAG: chain length determinant protein EpsF [Burkholderiaceae bacterium]